MPAARSPLAPFFASVVLGSVALACSTGADTAPDEHVARAQSPIIGGQLDTTHQAVVAIALQEGQQGGLCSGTIVKTDPTRKIGWVLTAAHCVAVSPVLVLQGDDFMSSSALRYDVLDYAADPQYTSQTDSPHDFAVIRIVGVDASTPTIPLVTSPDGLTGGSPVTSVGYGRTTYSDQTDTNNTVRRHVSRTIDGSQTTSTMLAYDMTDGHGICQGDSGGPVLTVQGGVEKVAGVHSFVTDNCRGYGVSDRVSSGRTFIDGELAKAAPADSCSLCESTANSGNGQCAQLTRGCLADPECGGYYKCLTECGGTASCKTSCLKTYPKAEGPFTAVTQCACAEACTDLCKGTLACQNVPKCGSRLPAGDCSMCTEGACCDETKDCTADGTCFLCLKNGDDSDPECATNAARKALATCVSSKCSTECAGTGLTNGADTTGDDDGGAPTGGTKRIVHKTTSCAASPGPAAGGGLWLAALGLALAWARRRRASTP